MVTSTLTLLDDSHGEYDDDIRYRRDRGEQVRGPLGRSPLLHETVRLLNRWVGDYDQCRRDELTLLGRCLYAVAFGDADGPGGAESPLRRAFEDTYRIHRDSLRETKFRLRLVIRSEARELGRYPWEFLYMPRPQGGGFFLAGGETELVLSRYIPNSDLTLPDEDTSPLRILVVVSSPNAPGLAEVKADTLVRALASLRSEDTIVEVLTSPTRAELRRGIVARPTHIIHVVGHGRRGAIALKKSEEELADDSLRRAVARSKGDEGTPDEADWADSISVCALLRAGLDGDPGPSGIRPRGRLIFLHACEGARPQDAAVTQESLDAFSGVARALADGERVTAVVAMQYEIKMMDAEKFAVEFYRGLSGGSRLDEAVTQARCELGVMPGGGRQAWNDRSFGTPVIYVRQESKYFRLKQKLDVRGSTAPSAAHEKPFCPNPYCRGSVIPGQSRCRACDSAFEECPKPSCPGLVMTAPGAKCTVCDYAVPARDEQSADRGPAARPARQDTGFDTSSAPRRPVDRSGKRR